MKVTLEDVRKKVVERMAPLLQSVPRNRIRWPGDPLPNIAIDKSLTVEVYVLLIGPSDQVGMAISVATRRYGTVLVKFNHKDGNAKDMVKCSELAQDVAEGFERTDAMFPVRTATPAINNSDKVPEGWSEVGVTIPFWFDTSKSP